MSDEKNNQKNKTTKSDFQDALKSSREENLSFYKELKENPDLFVDKLLEYENLSKNEQKVLRTKMTDTQSDKMFSFLERTLVIKEISGVDLDHKDNSAKNKEYTALVENVYLKDYEKLSKLIELREEDEEKFSRAIKEKKNQELLASFINLDKVQEYKNENGGIDAEKLFNEINTDILHRTAKKPEDYIFERHFDDDVFGKISNIFKEQVNVVNTKIDDQIKSGTSFDKQGGRLQRNDAILRAAQTELEMKVLKNAIKISVNPVLGTALVVGSLIANSKTFQKFSKKLKGKIAEKLENSEKFQNFKDNNPWIEKAKKSKTLGIVTKFVGISVLGTAAVMLASPELANEIISNPSGTFNSLKDGAANTFNDGVNSATEYKDKALSAFGDFGEGTSQEENLPTTDANANEQTTENNSAGAKEDPNENQDKATNNNSGDVTPPEAQPKAGEKYTFIEGSEINTLSEAVDTGLKGMLNELNSMDGVKVTFQDLVDATGSLNNIQNIDSVEVGQQITLPTKEEILEFKANKAAMAVENSNIGATGDVKTTSTTPQADIDEKGVDDFLEAKNNKEIPYNKPRYI